MTPERTTRRLVRLLLLLTGAPLALVGCSHEANRAYSPPPPPPGYPSPRHSTPAAPPKDAGTVPAVRMPQISPQDRPLSTEVGLASWYGTVYDHRRSADGQVYDENGMTAASRTLPLGTLARITNLTTGQVAVVRITDRGPFVPGRILDLSAGAARATGLYRMGIARVRVEGFQPEGLPEVPARWCVQIGAFLDPADAVQMKNDLLQRYATAKVISFNGPTGSWVRLTLPVPDRVRSDAIAAKVSVPDPGVAAYVTRLN